MFSGTGCGCISVMVKVKRKDWASAKQRDDGFWADAEGKTLPVSASDLERHSYCPLSWELAFAGVEGIGDALDEGQKKHEQIHDKMNQYHQLSLKTNRESMVWTWWLTVVLVLLIDAFSFFYIGELTPPGKLGIYLIMLAVVWLAIAMLMLMLPWRHWIGRYGIIGDIPAPKFETMTQEVMRSIFEDSNFVGGWGRGGRIEATMMIGAIILVFHGIALYGADNKEQAGFVLAILALIWTGLASWRLQRLLYFSNQALEARIEIGLQPEEKLSYSDDSKAAPLLIDESTGLRGRPDQIIKIDDEYIPVEQKTGRIPTKPYLSHTMQLLGYLQLIEVSTGTQPTFGALRYGENVAYQIEWDDENKKLLHEQVMEIQRLMVKGGASRNHERIGKCRNCSRRRACPESLHTEK